ncbi:hypothetical protein Taro_042305 [Colocasia esculenta]|uniref:Uncharacterized protein n=1 Tax=Colocasia esculenta TaxID=4460 RepID=A0A843WDM4_COLES|nr:hypothetical protein [Colocasia esculenta]
MVGMVPKLGRMSTDMRRGVSSRPQHPRVPQYFLHHHLWTMALMLQLQFPRSVAMVVHPSWRGLRGWLRLLLRMRVRPFWQRAG